jgi:hypothetical protein
MKQRWSRGRMVLLLLPLALLALAGCAKPTFSLVEKRVCKGVDSSGNPQPETTTFTPADGRVSVWFRYRGAGPKQTIKTKFTHTDDAGTESKQEVQTELKPGDGQGMAELAGPEGGALTPGKYTVEITNESDVAYGPAIAFTVR